MTSPDITAPARPPVIAGSSLDRVDPAATDSEQGRTSISDAVVGKIAGIAAREIPGVHDMGGSTARAFGAIKDKIVAGGPDPTQGVSVEVGEHQTAIDIDLVVDYGVSIVELARAVRRNVVTRVERMTGLEVTEVNITVDDIFLGDSQPEPARVQ